MGDIHHQKSGKFINTVLGWEFHGFTSSSFHSYLNISCSRINKKSQTKITVSHLKEHQNFQNFLVKRLSMRKHWLSRFSLNSEIPKIKCDYTLRCSFVWSSDVYRLARIFSHIFAAYSEDMMIFATVGRGCRWIFLDYPCALKIYAWE